MATRLKLQYIDDTDRKATDVEYLCGSDCGLWVLKGTTVPLDVAVIFLQELRSL